MQTGSGPTFQPTPDRVQQAIQALRSGDQVTARRLLAEELRADPASENAWLVMAAAVETPEQRRDCLERVLSLNPNNHGALQALRELDPDGDDLASEPVDSIAASSPQEYPPESEDGLPATPPPFIGAEAFAVFEEPAGSFPAFEMDIEAAEPENEIEPDSFAARLGSVLQDHQNSETEAGGDPFSAVPQSEPDDPSAVPLFNQFAYASSELHWDKQDVDAPQEGQVLWEEPFSENEPSGIYDNELEPGTVFSSIEYPTVPVSVPFPPAPVAETEGMLFPEQPATYPPSGGVIKAVLISLALLAAALAFFGGLLWVYLTWSELGGIIPADLLTVFGLPAGLVAGGLLLGIILVVALVRVLGTMQDALELQREGRITSGTVYRRWTESGTSTAEPPIYWILYRFVLHPHSGGEETFQIRERVDETLFNDLTESVEVPVRYLSRDPRISRMEVHN